MAFTEYLKINGELLPFPDSYDLSLSSVESDSGGETEAGTIQRDVVRQGVVDISVSFTVTAAWLKKLTVYSKKNKLTVQYFDTDTLSLKETEMYIDGFKAKLGKNFRRCGDCTLYQKISYKPFRATAAVTSGLVR